MNTIDFKNMKEIAKFFLDKKLSVNNLLAMYCLFLQQQDIMVDHIKIEIGNQIYEIDITSKRADFFGGNDDN